MSCPRCLQQGVCLTMAYGQRLRRPQAISQSSGLWCWPQGCGCVTMKSLRSLHSRRLLLFLEMCMFLCPSSAPGPHGPRVGVAGAVADPQAEATVDILEAAAADQFAHPADTSSGSEGAQSKLCSDRRSSKRSVASSSRSASSDSSKSSSSDTSMHPVPTAAAAAIPLHDGLAVALARITHTGNNALLHMHAVSLQTPVHNEF